jgi:hypothetical protein
MTIAGWIIMLLSVGGVTVLFAWCLYRVLTAPPADELPESKPPTDTFP